jgi:hypothetical protein
MLVLCAHVHVIFRLARDVEMLAVWNGDRWCQIQALDNGHYGPVVERWDMWKPGTETPAIPCTPQAVYALIHFRLQTPEAIRELAGLAREALHRHRAAPVPMQMTPEFSNN